jgi:anti-sigma B factor antagonist
MTSPIAAASENIRAWRDDDGETDVRRPGSAPPEPLLRLVPTHLEGHAILALVGEMDTTNTDAVREAVARCLTRKPATLSLDLSGLTFCGGGGIHTLNWALERAEADNVEFSIVAPTPTLRRVLTAIQARELLAATADAPRPEPLSDRPTGGRP